MEQKSIKEKIKFFRQKSKLTQHSMAILMGITQSYYQKIEAGDSYIQLLDFIKICGIFNIGLDDLLAFDIKTQSITLTNTDSEKFKKSSKNDEIHNNLTLLQVYNYIKEQEKLIKALIANNKSSNNNDKFLGK
jgi:transcriptional regulator with XRE-family HTH domain